MNQKLKANNWTPMPKKKECCKSPISCFLLLLPINPSTHTPMAYGPGRFGPLRVCPTTAGQKKLHYSRNRHNNRRPATRLRTHDHGRAVRSVMQGPASRITNDKSMSLGFMCVDRLARSLDLSVREVESIDDRSWRRTRKIDASSPTFWGWLGGGATNGQQKESSVLLVPLLHVDRPQSVRLEAWTA